MEQNIRIESTHNYQKEFDGLVYQEVEAYYESKTDAKETLALEALWLRRYDNKLARVVKIGPCWVLYAREKF